MKKSPGVGLLGGLVEKAKAPEADVDELTWKAVQLVQQRASALRKEGSIKFEENGELSVENGVVYVTYNGPKRKLVDAPMDTKQRVLCPVRPDDEAAVVRVPLCRLVDEIVGAGALARTIGPARGDYGCD